LTVHLSGRTIQRFISSGNTAQNMTDRGRALENLVCYVFGRIPGVSVTRRNTQNVFRTEEIDVAFWNERYDNGLHFLPNMILVECKNWSRAVTSAEVSYFDSIIRRRGLSFGVLVAANGITGDHIDQTEAQRILAAALAERRRIVVVTLPEIQTFRNTNQVVKLFKEKLCDLAVYGGLPL